MAGDPLCTFILIALGIHELSLNAGGIPMIKKIIRSISMEKAKDDLEEIFRKQTAAEVLQLVKQKVESLIPDVDKKFLAANGG